jgi:beta-galactosidase
MKTSHLLIAIFLLSSLSGFAQSRQSISLNNGWTTIADDTNPFKYNGFEKADFPTSNWQTVDVPHNWDRYEGFRRMKHGNRHGYAWYRRSFDVAYDANKRYFLFFEGVGSYATVFVNGQKVGEHAGGRTTFTLDITHAINKNGLNNLLAVRADHPAEIRDLPWVCGGCSDEWGFSEGSQPLGIFRPVSLEVTNNVRIEPFGVHIWNDTTATEKEAMLNLSVELKNYGPKNKNIMVVNSIVDANGKTLHSTSSKLKLPSGNATTAKQVIVLNDVNLWSPQSPYLYKVTTQVWDGKTLIDNIETPYGIRWIQWPIGRKNHTGQFFINGKPLFINGTAEYEHLMGISHAFSDDQIHARAMQIKALGYNAFRDAHQPHNLRFHPYWDQLGLLWWPQMAAHIWFDTPAFRENFKTLLRQMVKERRNSPSIILWGLENESTLPTDFAKECVAIIRELDPTAHNQRLVTTCNGGTGTDWNVVQNWSGTYGGNPFNYANEQKQQLLNGEYGAWRSIDLHTEGGYTASGPWSEDKMTLLMELKIREAEAAKDSSCGQFHWLLNSHENPGRTQNGEGLRDIDRVGPVNYKGLLTPWGEPTDAFYMYRSNYAPKTTDPMVYIVSHTWPNRYKNGGLKTGIIVYSNCDEVELFNDVDGLSLGKRINQGIGTHFSWDSINITYNTLKAIGYVDGKAVATDVVILQNLPFAQL